MQALPERGRRFAVFEHKARALLTPVRHAHDAPVMGCVLLESDSTQARGLEGRSVAMHSSLRLPDRSRLRLLNEPAATLSRRLRRTEAADVWLQRAPRAGVTTSPPFLARAEGEGGDVCAS
jgi:hypothetical protein